MRPIKFVIYFTVLFFCSAVQLSTAQENKTKKHRNGAIYFAWGYNQEWYTKSTIHINQPDLKNDYKMLDVKAHDHMGWNNKSIFKQAISIPQYNYRLGYYFNEKQDLGIEISFDHTKYIVTDNQQIRLSGVRNGSPTSETITFSEQNGFYYFLNNGANFLLFNFMKRWQLYHLPNRKFYLDAIAKAGVGPVIPHVENSLFGVKNERHFQIGGWNAGIETAVRATVMKYGFIEFAQKVDYARYSGLRLSTGTARQAFGTYELILTVGVIVPTRHSNPLFATVKKDHASARQE